MYQADTLTEIHVLPCNKCKGTPYRQGNVFYDGCICKIDYNGAIITESVKIELPRETAEERELKSIISDLQIALFRTRHGEACGEQVSKAWNKLGDFIAKQALAKIRI